MFRKSKIEPVEKVKIVERYLAGEIGIRQAGKELGVAHHSIRNWSFNIGLIHYIDTILITQLIE